MQPVDEAADLVVEPQAAFLDEAQDAGGGEALGMGGDAEAVARRQGLADLATAIAQPGWS